MIQYNNMIYNIIIFKYNDNLYELNDHDQYFFLSSYVNERRRIIMTLWKKIWPSPLCELRRDIIIKYDLRYFNHLLFNRASGITGRS